LGEKNWNFAARKWKSKKRSIGKQRTINSKRKTNQKELSSYQASLKGKVVSKGKWPEHGERGDQSRVLSLASCVTAIRVVGVYNTSGFAKTGK